MKEDKKHLYRIDPLKVQQKIYDMYPANSEVRKMMLKEQQLKEYGQLARTIASMPISVAEASLDHSTKHGLLHISKFAFFSALGLSLSPLLTWKFAFQNIALWVGVVTFLVLAIQNLFIAVEILRTLYLFSQSLKKAQSRMEKLKKEIFE